MLRAQKQHLFSFTVSLSCMHVVNRDQQSTQLHFNLNAKMSRCAVFFYINSPFHFNFSNFVAIIQLVKEELHRFCIKRHVNAQGVLDVSSPHVLPQS